MNEKIATARMKDVDVSYKKAAVVMDAIRGMPLMKAESYLEEVIAKKKAIPFKKYNTSVGHRKGGVIGKYPVKASRMIIKLLKSVENNAEDRGLDKEKLIITHAKADKGAIIPRIKPKGRMMRSDIVLTHMEVTVKEV